MAQSGYTPIQLYYSTTAAAVPVNTNLASGELALNIQDEKLYFKNAAGTVKLLASNATSAPVTSFQTSLSGLTPSTSTTGAVTLAGTLGTANGGTNLTSFTSGGVVYASSTSALATGSNLYFDGTNLGVGVTSPSQKLELAGVLRVKNGNADTNGLNLSSDAAGVSTINSGYAGAGQIVFQTEGTERMRLTSTGLGIGTSSPGAKLGVTTATAGFATILTNTNGASDSNGLYVKSGTVSTEYNLRLSNTSGSTDFMSVKGDGNVGIGTSSPTTKLEVNGNVFKIYDQGTANANLVVRNSTTGNAAGFTLQQDGVNTLLYNSSNGYMVFATNATERARIDSSGNVGIGTSSPSTSLTVSGANTAARGQVSVIGASSADARVTLYRNATLSGAISCTSTQMYIDAVEAVPLAFYTSDTQRAQISAAGGFSVGTTADPGAGAIYATGNITAYYSDARLKTVSGKIENALDKVAQLSGVYYTNNETAKSFGYDSDEVQVGVLAQDVEAVLPQIVKAAPFDLDENGNSKSGENYKTVQYERLVPLLIEAINELQAKVKALESK